MMEITIAIMMFSLCLLPLIGTPMKMLSGQKKTLATMESYMRSHEVMFFFLQNFKNHHPSYDFVNNSRTAHKFQDMEGLKLPVPFNKLHYHIYHNGTKKEQELPYNHLHCHICFENCESNKRDDNGKKCGINNKESKHTFSIIVHKENHAS